MRRVNLDGRPHPPQPEIAAFERYFKVLASLYLPRAVRAIGEKAAQGDTEAAALLLEFLSCNAEELAPGCWEDHPSILAEKPRKKNQGKGFNLTGILKAEFGFLKAKPSASANLTFRPLPGLGGIPSTYQSWPWGLLLWPFGRALAGHKKKFGEKTPRSCRFFFRILLPVRQ